MVDDNVRIMARRFTTEPFAIRHGYFNPSLDPSVKIMELIHLIQGIVKEDELLPPLEKRKILIHQSWSALLPFVRARLAQHEIYSSHITGTTPFAERVQRIAKFQMDEDHPSSPTAWLLPQERRVVHHLDEPSRVMFITDVGAAGLKPVSSFRPHHARPGMV
jgi:hypothetical protein